MTVLPNLQQQLDAALALVAKQQELLAAATKPRKISMKVTAKREDGTGTDGALSIYGLGRWPTTLYRSQWERLLAEAPAIHAFIEANSDLLVTKD
jgi:hypothetical protein